MRALRQVKRRPANMLGKWFSCGSYGDTLGEAILPINDQLKKYGFELVERVEGDDTYHLGLVNHLAEKS